MRISDWSSDVCSSDLLYQSSCRLPFRKADQTGFNESLNVNVRFCWDLRKTFRPHAEALPILIGSPALLVPALRSEEHTSELQSLMRISYAVFCLKKQNQKHYYYQILHNTPAIIILLTHTLFHQYMIH